MELIKEAFSKVKLDLEELNGITNKLKESLLEIKHNFLSLNQRLSLLEKKQQHISSLKIKPFHHFPNNSFFQRYSFISENNSLCGDKTQNKKNLGNTEDIQTDKINIKPPNNQIIPISTGNEGVKTDRQTDRQTDRHEKKDILDLDGASEIINSLDFFKKELRLKFKRLTSKELLVFSTIYQLDQEEGYSNYKSISSRLNLTESSIRDYVQRLLIKNIPLQKTKLNNKEIRFNIPLNLKKIASLSTILQLIEL